MKTLFQKILVVGLVLLFPSILSAQSNVIDNIAAVIGNEYILKSEIENAYLQGQSELADSEDPRADLLEQLLIQKLLCAEALLDSVFVSEAEVDAAIYSRIDDMIETIGSEERLVAYFGESITELADDMRPSYRSMLIAQRMQEKIQENVRVTPAEVRAFYKKIPKDSLLEIPAKYEIQQIVLKPTISEAEKERCRERLRTLRERVLNGETSFATLAVLYSEDPGSSARGGELGYFGKSTMDPAFSEAAFSLKEGSISKIVETEYGYHIIQLIDRQGEKINARHILIIPQVSAEEKRDVLKRLDTLKNMISNKEMTFENAALYFSTDKNSRNNGGLIVDMYTGDIRLPKTSITGEMARVVNRLNVGEISDPFVDINANTDSEEYKIIKIKAYYPAHISNLEEDWEIFENALVRQKQQDVLIKWIQDKQKNTYIHLADEYKDAQFHYDGWVK